MIRSAIRSVRLNHSGTYGYWDTLALERYDESPRPHVQETGETYQRYTAQPLANLDTLPTSSRMLSRDFIHNSLYHPKYGYFSTRADVFTLKEPFKFAAIKDNNEFFLKLAECYREIEDKQIKKDGVATQIWHTPTELFRPW
jgi:hypothetical protein